MRLFSPSAEGFPNGGDTGIFCHDCYTCCWCISGCDYFQMSHLRAPSLRFIAFAGRPMGKGQTARGNGISVFSILFFSPAPPKPLVFPCFPLLAEVQNRLTWHWRFIGRNISAESAFVSCNYVKVWHSSRFRPSGHRLIRSTDITHTPHCPAARALFVFIINK